MRLLLDVPASTGLTLVGLVVGKDGRVFHRVMLPVADLSAASHALETWREMYGAPFPRFLRGESVPS